VGEPGAHASYLPSQNGELDKVMAYFDLDDDGHISLNEFIRGIRSAPQIALMVHVDIQGGA
jgi:hypothetical protein